MKGLLPILLVCYFASSNAQDSLSRKPPLAFSGYVKEVFWLRFDKAFLRTAATNLVHNRINIKWNPSENLSGRLELRNRLYWGDDVKSIPAFASGLRNQNQATDLSVTWWHHASSLMHTNIERSWIEYRKPTWNTHLGRQRINWGLANNWNPNDIFNSFNFLDFDYEERPGSDAVKWQYSLKNLSQVEVAMALTNDQPITAARYFTNFKKYDLQGILGWYKDYITAGMGWAGSISTIGFKGEVQYYDEESDSLSSFNGTVEADYLFKDGWYLSSALLYNEKGLSAPLKNGDYLNFLASPRNLMPARWSFLVNVSREFSPIFSIILNLVYAPGVNLLILFPDLKYNMKPNLDLDLVWQSFFASMRKFRGLSHTGFLRLRWSF